MNYRVSKYSKLALQNFRVYEKYRLQHRIGGSSFDKVYFNILAGG
jgi:hypothetical protein